MHSDELKVFRHISYLRLARPVALLLSIFEVLRCFDLLVELELSLHE